MPGTPHTYLPCDQISGMCSNFYVFYDVIKGKKRVIKMSRPSCHTLKDRYNIFDTLRKLHAHIRLLAIQPGICGSSLWHHKRVRNDQNCKRCSPQTMVVPQAQGVGGNRDGSAMARARKLSLHQLQRTWHCTLLASIAGEGRVVAAEVFLLAWREPAHGRVAATADKRHAKEMQGATEMQGGRV